MRLRDTLTYLKIHNLIVYEDDYKLIKKPAN
jgi:hypothetical protein